ncbi:hypothetical protein [Ferrimonas sp. YFM]|uniref:hypothetical protein n=1 Tax=Ferrimonas sp. YFM TaxID=3028878 RepID=UPI002572C091|nr:hypothetical protein [Ferrimonas sp. YFM]BDY04659.1 hypothetical protein F0521_17000 [Ferrimonas sp. YFM]
MAWMERCSIKTKFALLVWLPFGLVLLLAGSLLGAQGGKLWQDRLLPERAQLMAEGRRLVLTLQRERVGLIPGRTPGENSSSLSIATDLAVNNFLAAQGQWLSEQEAKTPELVGVNAVLGRLGWMRNTWLDQELSLTQWSSYLSQSVAAVNRWEKQFLATLPHGELASRAQALAEVAQAQESLLLLPFASSEVSRQRLVQETNLHLSQYRDSLNAKSAGQGGSRPPLALAQVLGDQGAPAQERAQALTSHMKLQSQFLFDEMQSQWRGSVVGLGWLLSILTPVVLLAWGGCRGLALSLQRRIIGLSLAIRALDQQRNYHVKLTAGDQDELDTMIHHLNNVIDDACKMRSELQLARQQLDRAVHSQSSFTDPKVTPIRPVEGAQSEPSLNQT